MTFSADYAYLVMDRVGLSIADTFRDSRSKDPTFEFEEGKAVAKGVRDTLRRLAAAKILYLDRTPYNFMLINGSVMVIDFEHAKAVEGECHEPDGDPLWDEDYF